MVILCNIGLFFDHKKHIFGPKKVEFGQIIVRINSNRQIRQSNLVELVQLVKFDQIRNSNLLFQIRMNSSELSTDPFNGCFNVVV